MKYFVIHECELNSHMVPLQCACHAVGRENGVFMFCVDRSVVDELPIHTTARRVKFQTGMGSSYHDVTRLTDVDKDAPNNRE